MEILDQALRDIRRRQKAEPRNLELQQKVDHLDQIFPETTPWVFERRRWAGFRAGALAFLLVGAIFTCGLQSRAGAPEQQVQQMAVRQEPEPEVKMTWAEGLAAVGIFLGGVGGLAAWVRRGRRRD